MGMGFRCGFRTKHVYLQNASLFDVEHFPSLLYCRTRLTLRTNVTNSDGAVIVGPQYVA